MQQNGTDNNISMKHLSQNVFGIVVGISLCISCFPIKRDGHTKNPTEIKGISDIAKKIQDIDPSYYSVIDVSRMRIYSLGGYYLAQSILCGPSGRASNYYHYLLTDSSFSSHTYFMSLSSEISNIWIDGDSLFVDLLDFIDEAYYNGVYSNCDNCDYFIFNMKLSTPSFELDTISEEKVSLGWNELITFSRQKS